MRVSQRQRPAGPAAGRPVPASALPDGSHVYADAPSDAIVPVEPT